MWGNLGATLAQLGIGALSAAITASLAVLLPAGQDWLRKQAGVTKAELSQRLSGEMDLGAVNILRSARWLMSEPLPAVESMSKNDYDRLIRAALPRFRQNFAESLRHFGMDEAAARDYLAARVNRALA